jgi:exonuclease SbcC
VAAWSLAASRLTDLFGAEPADFPSWLSGQLAKVQQEAQRLAEQETRLRQATISQQQAQENHNTARKGHDAIRDEAALLKAGAERTLSAIQASRDHLASVQQRQEKALEQLDRAHPDPSWRSGWAAGPQQYHAACRKEAAQWSAQKKTSESLLAEIASLDVAAQGLSRLTSKAEADHRQSGLALTEIGRQLQEQQSARRSVFAGMKLPAHPEGVQPPPLDDADVQQIESHLSGAIEAARRQQANALHAFKESEQQLAVQQETLAQLAKQLAANQTAARQAAASLKRWQEDFNARSPEDLPLDSASLHGLLACDSSWIAAERQALGQLETAIASATGGLAQMRNQRASHENARPTADEPETVQANLEQAAALLNGLRENLSGIELALRRDDEVRQKAAELLDTLAAQEKTARLWAQMNDLIGAADGKKFRNYAQQLTLDILIGYANAHLKDLSRRYRLSRVKDSLALMVIDQDMGDEQRSVHSLSGGESFLVSLSLALGLASLSSHRVRVESLFIDEGFGSLDADTLRVAMDALDSLQAMGRKVGVISHVQEMTERIGTCVQVKRMAGGQSQVVIAGG